MTDFPALDVVCPACLLRAHAVVRCQQERCAYARQRVAAEDRAPREERCRNAKREAEAHDAQKLRSGWREAQLMETIT